MMAQRTDQDFSDEIQAHIRLETDALIEEGIDPQEAELRARRLFGNVTQSQERFYESTRWMAIDHLLRNVRYAFRQMRNTPVSTGAILLSLVLGIGLTTSIFSIADQVLVRSLPVADPDSLVQLEWDGLFVTAGMGGVGYGHLIPFPLYQQLSEEGDVFESMFARTGTKVHLGLGERSFPVRAEIVTGSFFPTLGISPEVGRLLSPSDDKHPGGHPFVVLSHALWQSHHGGKDTVLGTSVRINDEPFTVVGIAPPNFHGTDWSLAPSLWIPMAMKEQVTGWSGVDEPRTRFSHVFARLGKGGNRENVAARLDPWFSRYLQTDTERSDWPSVNEEQRTGFLASRLNVLPGGQGQAFATRRIASPILILVGATGLVFLLACLNIANLSLARALAGRRATALRTALGASRARIVGESFIESAVLAVVGGGMGILAAPAVSRFALSLFGDSIGGGTGGGALRADLDPRMLGLALAATTVITLLAGAAPAAFAASIRPSLALQQRGAGASGGLGFRKALVIGQFSLALVLLIGAALFAQTLSTLRGEGPGYNTTNLLTLQIAPRNDGYDAESTKALTRRIEERLLALPETSNVGVTAYEMLKGGGWNNQVTVFAPGRKIFVERSTSMNAITPGLFKTIGAQILRGRDFTEADSRDSGRDLKSVILNQEFVDFFLDGKDPLGSWFGFGIAPDGEPDMKIVGIVSNFQDAGLREPEPQIYFPLWERTVHSANFYVRTTVSVEQAMRTVRKTIAEIDPALTIISLHTLDDQLDRLLATERILAVLAGAFAVVATLLAMIGMYGVLSFSAERRRNEIGIRLALGAPSWAAGGLLVREAMILAGVGLAIALPTMWALGRVIEHQLFGVGSMDPLTILVAVSTLLLVVLVASLQPARKLSRLNLLEALRTD